MNKIALPITLLLLLSSCTTTSISSSNSSFSSNTSDNISSSSNSIGDISSSTEEQIFTGTYGRKFPTYYQPNVPLINNAKVIYINLDAFPRYIFDLARRANVVPTLEMMITEGSFINNLSTSLPSITGAIQTSILAGATASQTHNVNRYYNKESKIVIQQNNNNAYENQADNIFAAATRNELSTLGIAQVFAKAHLSTTETNKLYISPVVDSNVGSYESRFNELIAIIKSNKTTAGKQISLPAFTGIYVDDLDAIGHNQDAYYGYDKIASSEEERVSRVVDRLEIIDKKLGELITIIKERGLERFYSLFITTDHGMVGFGKQDGACLPFSDDGTNKLTELTSVVENLNVGSTSIKMDLEVVAPTSDSNNPIKPKAATNIVGVTTNLNLQLTLLKNNTELEIEKIATELRKQNYVHSVLTRADLREMGYWLEAADLIVSPKSPYNFGTSSYICRQARGQHDSMENKANKIFGLAWGKGIKKNYILETMSFNYDFGVTMAAALGVTLNKANGIVLDIFEK